MNSRAVTHIGILVGVILIAVGMVGLWFADVSGFFSYVQGCPGSIGGPCASGAAIATAIEQFVVGIVLIVTGVLVAWRL